MVIGGDGTNGTLQMDDATSEYQIDQRRFALGAEFELSNKLSFQVGLRKEEIITSYPAYYNIPIVFGNGGQFNPAWPSVSELITDLAIYETKIKSTKGIVFASVTVSL